IGLVSSRTASDSCLSAKAQNLYERQGGASRPAPETRPDQRQESQHRCVALRLPAACYPGGREPSELPSLFCVKIETISATMKPPITPVISETTSSPTGVMTGAMIDMARSACAPVIPR